MPREIEVAEDDPACLKDVPTTNMEEPCDKEPGVREDVREQSNLGEPPVKKSGVKEVGDDDTTNSQKTDQSSLLAHCVVVPSPEASKPRTNARKSRTLKPKKPDEQFNLAYFTLWWKRMEREGERVHADTLKENERIKNLNRMQSFLRRQNSFNSNNNTKNSLNLAKNVKFDNDECSDVIHARPPYVLNECQPNMSSPNLLSGLEAGEGVRGPKRFLSDRLDSPSKRQRNFKTLLSFWGNPTGVVQEPTKRNRPTSYVNTTQPDRPKIILMNSAKSVTEPADRLRYETKTKHDSFPYEGDPTFRGLKKNGSSTDGF